MKIFKCKFNGGSTCEVRVSDTCPPKGKAHIEKFIWTGSPTKKVIPHYVKWVNSVNKQLSDEWGVKLLHIFCIEPNLKKVQVFVYEPGVEPKDITQEFFNGN